MLAQPAPCSVTQKALQLVYYFVNLCPRYNIGRDIVSASLKAEAVVVAHSVCFASVASYSVLHLITTY